MNYHKNLLIVLLAVLTFSACDKVDNTEIIPDKPEPIPQRLEKNPTAVFIYGDNFDILDREALPRFLEGSTVSLTANILPSKLEDPTIIWTIAQQNLVDGTITISTDTKEIFFKLIDDFSDIADEDLKLTVRAASKVKPEIYEELTFPIMRRNPMYEYFLSANTRLAEGWIMLGSHDIYETEQAYLTDDDGNPILLTDGRKDPNMYFPVIREKEYGKSYTVSTFSYDYALMNGVSFEATFDETTNEIVFFTQECKGTVRLAGQDCSVALCAVLAFADDEGVYFNPSDEPIEIMRGKAYVYNHDDGLRYDGIQFTHSKRDFEGEEATLANAILGVDDGLEENQRAFFDSPIFYPFMVDRIRPFSLKIHYPTVSE